MSRTGYVTAFAADLGWRMALTVVAAVLVGIEAPTPLTTFFTVLAAAVVTERVVRYRRRGMLDAALVGLGLLVVVMGLLGLLLNYLPGGIVRVSWSIGLVLIALGALTLAGLYDGDVVPASPFRPILARKSAPTAIWSAGAVTILAVALLISVRSFDRTHVAPLDLSSSVIRSGFATVTVSAGSAQGPFELDLVNGSVRTALADHVTIAPGTSTAIVVAVPAEARVLVQLVEPGSTTALRQLIFDGTATTHSTTTTDSTTTGTP